MKKTSFRKNRAFAVIHTAALARNFRLLSSQVPHARTIAVVKANAYGHGVELAVPTLLAASDIFMFPSWQEGLPVSQMEAMAAGLT